VKRRYTVACDMDGVLHEYSTPWIAPHVIPDSPVAGAIEWLHKTLQEFAVVIFTTRGRTWRGRRAVRRWLKKYGNIMWDTYGDIHGFEEVKVTDRKPAALIYLDDRAWRFEGKNFPTMQEIHNARPWHKLPDGDFK